MDIGLVDVLVLFSYNFASATHKGGFIELWPVVVVVVVTHEPANVHLAPAAPSGADDESGSFSRNVTSSRSKTQRR